jgi:AraC-like DNA-binding protein
MVNELRVQEARRILNETRASVTEACYASGFSNLSHFHTVFKRQTGCSPLKFRSRFEEIAERSNHQAS